MLLRRPEGLLALPFDPVGLDADATRRLQRLLDINAPPGDDPEVGVETANRALSRGAGAYNLGMRG
jgi:hypothetical protein